MNAFMLWIAVAATLLAFGFRKAGKRSMDLRAMASRRGLHYIGDSFPRSFTLNGTALERASSVENVLEGTCNGIRVVAFDFGIGKGRAKWSGTAIAAQGSRDVFGGARFITEFEFERSTIGPLCMGG